MDPRELAPNELLLHLTSLLFCSQDALNKPRPKAKIHRLFICSTQRVHGRDVIFLYKYENVHFHGRESRLEREICRGAAPLHWAGTILLRLHVCLASSQVSPRATRAANWARFPSAPPRRWANTQKADKPNSHLRPEIVPTTSSMWRLAHDATSARLVDNLLFLCKSDSLHSQMYVCVLSTVRVCGSSWGDEWAKGLASCVHSGRPSPAETASGWPRRPI